MSLPISLVSSIAANATRLPPSSTTAMFIGWPTLTASCLHAAMTASAWSSVIWRAILPPRVSLHSVIPADPGRDMG
jgi:hypothetical protein